MIVELLNSFEPESDGLLREISNHVDDEMLERISNADFGMGQDEHLVALRQVRDTGTFPTRMYWYCGEVLELFRNSEPRCGDPDRRLEDEFAHWARAFCCAALLRATRAPCGYGDGIATGETTIQLVHSLRALPVDLTPQAVRFFAWLALDLDPEGKDNQVCAYGIAMLWFALHLSPPIADETLIFLSKWIARRSKELYAELLFDTSTLPLRMGVGNPPPSKWDSLGGALFDLDLSARSPELKELIQQIGLELAG
jgi:hypothetical protein